MSQAFLKSKFFTIRESDFDAVKELHGLGDNGRGLIYSTGELPTNRVWAGI